MQECRKRKREEERVLSDRLLDSQEKVVELRKALKKRKLPCSEELANHEIVQEPHEQVRDQPAEELEDDEEIKKCVYSNMEALCEAYARDEAACKGLTSMDPCEFNDFVAESTPALDAMTYRGKQGVCQSTSTPIPHCSFIFLTLFWLQHYPTIEVLSLLFKLHK